MGQLLVGIVSDTLDKLTSLGELPYIVTELRKRGITGDRRVSNRCVLAEYLHTELDCLNEMAVSTGWSPGRSVPGCVSWRENGTAVGVLLHPVLTELARRFDDGKLPELEKAWLAIPVG